jgi:hypothetical protein
MDDNRFDGIAKLLGASTARRRALGSLAALGIGWATGGIESADAKKNKGKRKGNRGNRGKGNRGNKPKCTGDASCPGCLVCVEGRCRNIPAECDLLACEEMVCEPPSDGSGKSYYQCKSWCSGDEFCHYGKCCPKGVETCGVECCEADEICKDGECVENPCADQPRFTKPCRAHTGNYYFCCKPCNQCCSGPGGGNRCCQPSTCGATCEDGWCIGGNAACSCPMP